MNLLSLCYSGVEKPTYGWWELAVPLDVENPTYTFMGICAKSIPNGVEWMTLFLFTSSTWEGVFQVYRDVLYIFRYP